MLRFAHLVFALLPVAASAQSEAPSADRRCEELLLDYGSAAWDHRSDTLLQLEAPGGGALYYFGAAHSDDPGDPQFAAIEAAFAAFDPTVVFYEGPERPLRETREETIRDFGESGFVRHLAARGGLRVARLEPDPRAEIEYVLERFTPEQAGLFYVLRETARLRERKGMGEGELRAAIATLLGRAGALLPYFPLATIDDLEAAYRRTWSDPADWWLAPAAWFDPVRSGEETGGGFTNEVNRASSSYRNLHMMRVLSEAARGGERVFAVVGRSHVTAQAEALSCMLVR